MRPKDEDGKLLPPPARRLEQAPALIATGLLAVSQDGRAIFMTTKRKIAFVERVLNHVVDGDKPPKAIFKKDDYAPNNHFLWELWKTAERAIRRDWNAMKAEGAER